MSRPWTVGPLAGSSTSWPRSWASSCTSWGPASPPVRWATAAPNTHWLLGGFKDSGSVCGMQRASSKGWLLWSLPTARGFPGGSVGKESAHNAGEVGLICGLGRSPGGGHGNPLQCSSLENPMDRGAWWATVPGVAKSQTRLSDYTQHSQSPEETV